MKTTRRYRTALRVLLGLGLFAWVLGSVDLRGLTDAMAGAHARFLGYALAAVLVTRILNAWQLVIAVRHFRIALPLWRAVWVNAIAGFYSLMTVGELAGGAVKWYRLSAASGKTIEILAVMLFLKLINTAFILLFGLAALLLENAPAMGRLFWLSLPPLGATLLLLYLICASPSPPRPMKTVWRYMVHRAPDPLRHGMAAFWPRLTHYRTMSPAWTAALIAVPFLRLVISTLVLWFCARALGLELPLAALVWLNGLIYITQLIPASISGLGLREGALVLLLPMYGIPPAAALAFSLLLFALGLAVGLAGGLFELYDALTRPARPSGTPNPASRIDATEPPERPA